jgi:hypothetical protein
MAFVISEASASNFGSMSLADMGRMYAQAAAGDPQAQAAWMNLKAIDPHAARLAPSIVKAATEHPAERKQRERNGKAVRKQLDLDDYDGFVEAATGGTGRAGLSVTKSDKRRRQADPGQFVDDLIAAKGL